MPISLWFVEKNQRVIITGRVAEGKAVGCSSMYKGLSPFPASPEVAYIRLQILKSR